LYICKIQYFIKIFFKFIRFLSKYWFLCLSWFHGNFGDIYKCHCVLYLSGSDSRQHPTLYKKRFTYRHGKLKRQRRWPRQADERQQDWTYRSVFKVRVCFKRQRYGQSWALSWGITEVGYMSGCWDRERNREWKRKQARETEEEGTQVSVGNSSLLP